MNYLERMKILRAGESFDGVDCLTAGVEFGHGNACEVESAEFYFGLCRRNKFPLVVTTGCHFGFDTAWIASALKENGIGYPHLEGKVITVDVDDYGASKLWSRLGLDNIRQIVGDSQNPKTYEKQIPRPINWFHADADHSAEALINEFHIALPYLDTRKCFFSTHDSRLDVRLAPGIKQILKELHEMRDRGQGWKFVSWWPFRNLRGLDLIMLSNEDF